MLIQLISKKGNYIQFDPNYVIYTKIPYFVIEVWGLLYTVSKTFLMK